MLDIFHVPFQIHIASLPLGSALREPDFYGLPYWPTLGSSSWMCLFNAKCQLEIRRREVGESEVRTFNSLPSCCLNEWWLHPSSKIHSSCRETLSYSFSSMFQLQQLVDLLSLLGLPHLAAPGCHLLFYWFTSILLILQQILPTSSNSLQLITFEGLAFSIETLMDSGPFLGVS